jgi:trans-2,3-dihydro-3-hydroxyanthranilate isomerase
LSSIGYLNAIQLQLSMPTGMRFSHVDVFADRPLTGNGLVVFFDTEDLSAADMQALTREMRQFESIFLTRKHEARIFSAVRELDFAGHPILGAAAALHDADAGAPDRATWTIRLGGRDVAVATARRSSGGYTARMDQGTPAFGAALTRPEAEAVLAALNLPPDAAAGDLRPQVVSTGLRYLIVPVRSGLEDARIVAPDFAGLIAQHGAQFAYVLDPGTREARHWENDGSVEDVATGSAAGPAGAYRVRHGRARPGETIVVGQGRFLGRPSAIHVTVRGRPDAIERVEVAGPVAMVASGRLSPSAPPRRAAAAAT